MTPTPKAATVFAPPGHRPEASRSATRTINDGDGFFNGLPAPARVAKRAVGSAAATSISRASSQCPVRSGSSTRDNGQMARTRRLLLLAVALVTATSACAVARVAVRPVDTTVPAGPGVPPVSDAAHAAGFVDVRSVVPDAIIDLRYATTNNFTGTQLYPSDARCLVHQSMAPGLAAAATALRPQGHVLVFWDC